MNALDALDSWPVTAAVTVVGAHGVIDSRGDVHQRMPIASVTKPLVAMAALVAIEDGIVELDTPAGVNGATVHHLLAHCSGLAFDRDTVLSPPGRTRSYSNAGFAVLAEIIEQASGIVMSDYLLEAVLQPLSMNATTLDGHPGKDVTSTVADLTRFASDLIRTTLIDQSTFVEATTVQFPGLRGVLPGIGSFDPLDWGLGFQLNSSHSMIWAATHFSETCFGHFGATGSFLWVDPSRELAVVGLTGREFGPWARVHWPRLGDAIVEEFDNA